MSRFFASSGIEVRLLTGSIGGTEKASLLAALESGACQMLVATHAVIQSNVVMKNLKMIVDEIESEFYSDTSSYENQYFDFDDKSYITDYDDDGYPD